ncbi:hypothetical protein K432DRAFT_410877 [Lepidopterella palustris CBS 459.81]|uniref:Uncharacterized protein n=1 Tax=Lepidopterella palustris CBS 459.81 TaxID=1314670 RepID=A0A8E2DXA2_9PEZI|nr:hypothetical protein K432DRAFT_410877 [Lepidopterella palustris CBS 459.81]
MPAYIKKKFIKKFNTIIEKYNVIEISNNILITLIKRYTAANKKIYTAPKKTKKGGTLKLKST